MSTKKEDINVDDYLFAGVDRNEPEPEIENADYGNEVVSEEAPAPEPPPKPKAKEPEPEPEPEPEAAAPEGEPTDTVSEPEAEAGEPVKAEEPEEPQPHHMIPKARFDEVNERRKVAERKLREKEEAERLAKEAEDRDNTCDLSDREQAYMEAVLEGDIDTALAIRNEIREAERVQYQREMREQAKTVTKLTRAEEELNAAIDESVKTYPVFNKESAKFSQEITDDVLERFEGFKAVGYQPAAAMRKAVFDAARIYGLDSPEETPEPKPSAEIRNLPTAKQRQRKLEVEQNQPPLPGSRSPETGINVLQLPEEEFEKLSDAELAKLRGDVL